MDPEYQSPSSLIKMQYTISIGSKLCVVISDRLTGTLWYVIYGPSISFIVFLPALNLLVIKTRSKPSIPWNLKNYLFKEILERLNEISGETPHRNFLLSFFIAFPGLSSFAGFLCREQYCCQIVTNFLTLLEIWITWTPWLLTQFKYFSNVYLLYWHVSIEIVS